MGIIDTIIHAKHDLIRVRDRAYWGVNLDIQTVPKTEITEKKAYTPTEIRLLSHELSGKEPVEELILLDNKNKKMGRLTTSQIKEILSDMGFNVGVWISGAHNSDFSAVMNINGFLIPGWENIVKFLSKKFPSWEKLLLTKLAPGRDRLHIRIYEMNSGKWAILAHTDWNWMNLNLFKVYKAHLTTGEGDYITGTLMMAELLKSFNLFLSKNKHLTYDEITRICRWTYYQSMASSFKKAKFSFVI